MVWVLRSSGKPPPRYDYGSGHFTIKMHHSGKWGGTVTKNYIGGSVCSFDYCHADELSLIELSTMAKELGHGEAKYYYKENGSFILIWEDKQLMDFACSVDLKLRILHMYMEHDYVNEVVVGTQASQSTPSIVVDEGGHDDEDSDEYELKSSSSEEDDIKDEFHDSDYNFSGDDLDFEANIDEEIEFVGLPKKIEVDKTYEKTIDKLADIDGSDDSGSSNDFSSGSTSSDEGDSPRRPKKKIKYKKFNEKADMADPKFIVGMEFKSHAIFRDAVKQHAIKWGKQIKFNKNDRKQVGAVCIGGKKRNCPWGIYASYVPADEVFRVKTYDENHTCGRSYNVSGVSSKWICKKYSDRIRLNPTWPVKSLATTIEQEWTCKVSLWRVYRAKQKALLAIHGTEREQYRNLYAYAEEIMSCNPGTRIIIKSKPVVGSDNQVKFKRLYICWGALKKGLLEGCRPVICLDGCHLKGPYGGILLTAVGIDANNCIYPFAYAVVGKEKRKTWQWFLELVGEDLDIQNTYGWTFMSDKQKGLIDAVANLFPNASHRFCVRHLYNNFKGEFKGMVLKDALWKAARATTVPAFKIAMEEIREIDPEAYKWLCERPPINWSRSHFSTFPKCDLLLNNLCESFNSAILIARDQPIISMLEKIRHIIIDMLVKRKESMEKYEGDICPKINKIVEKLKSKVGEWVTHYTGNNKYEVKGASGVQYKVDLVNKICGCRRWDLCGIPCIHAVAAYSVFGDEPVDHVHIWYNKDTYLKTYNNMLQPINGKDSWGTTLTMELLPPDVKKRPGRPKKARTKDPEEGKEPQQVQPDDPRKLSRRGRKMRCSKCHQYGHNMRGCKKDQAVDGEDAGRTVMQGPQNEGTTVVEGPHDAGVGENITVPTGETITVPKATRKRKLPVQRKKKVGEVEKQTSQTSLPAAVIGVPPEGLSQTSSITNGPSNRSPDKGMYLRGKWVRFRSSYDPTTKWD